MTEYIYKGFKIKYVIEQLDADTYKATGSVLSYVKEQGPHLSQQFQTEGASKNYVQQEIKKIMNEYIDFEWKQFNEMQGEN